MIPSLGIFNVHIAADVWGGLQELQLTTKHFPHGKHLSEMKITISIFRVLRPSLRVTYKPIIRRIHTCIQNINIKVFKYDATLFPSKPKKYNEFYSIKEINIGTQWWTF
jgi:hypothetical protein